MSYKVYTENEVVEVETIEEAIEIAQSEYEEGYEGKSGFQSPWIEDEDGNQVDYDRPGYFVSR